MADVASTVDRITSLRFHSCWRSSRPFTAVQQHVETPLVDEVPGTDVIRQFSVDLQHARDVYAGTDELRREDRRRLNPGI